MNARPSAIVQCVAQYSHQSESSKYGHCLFGLCKCLRYGHSNYRSVTVSYEKDTFLTFCSSSVNAIIGFFFLTSIEACAARGGYVYSRHAKHAICRLESSCQCLLYFYISMSNSTPLYGYIFGARALGCGFVGGGV